MSLANTSGWTVKRGDGGGTEVFTSIGEIFGVSGLGVNNNLIDVTSFDSAGSREYIGGLADGQELTIEANYLPADTEQVALVNDVENKTNRNIQITHSDGTTTTQFDFAVTPISWNAAPSVDDKNVITFGLKISGAITRS